MSASYRTGLATAAFLLLATVAAPASAREQETLNQVYDTGRNPRLSLKNINGDLTIEGWDQDRFEVKAVKSASSREYLDDLEIRFHMEDDHLRIEVDYGRDRKWRRNTSASVDFEIRAPRGTEVDAVEMVNGDIEIVGVDGDVEVSSVNGSVAGRTLGGHVALATVNGGVSLMASGGVDSIRMNSVNGGVTLVLPKQFDARISAGTLHGSIRAAEDLEVEATSFTGSSMQGTIGKGGLRIDLNTVNGSIEIRREGEGEAREKK